MAEDAGGLRAWLYDIDQHGRSAPTWPDAKGPARTVPRGSVLHVSVDGGQDSRAVRYLRVPPAEGMASEPVRVEPDPETGHWLIRNSGRTNTLRVQQYGLPATPLRPRAAMPMTGEDTAVWIPVVPSAPRTRQSEDFRLLILSAPEPEHMRGTTTMITAPRRFLSPAMQEALVAYFGEHLSWPPLPAPHVRQQKEVEEIAVAAGLAKEPSPQHWARNRHDVLAGRDGLFTVADWYPRLGGPGRTLANHLAAFSRLVELGSITLRRTRRWAAEHDVRPYVITDDM